MRAFLVCAVPALLLGACSSTNIADPVTDTMAKTPFMYKPDIQQGNVVTQEQVNKLTPGMTTEQVRYLLGTPMLQDTFHQNRWDYVYTMKRGGSAVEKKRISLTFEDDQLTTIEGDFRPDPSNVEQEKETVVNVPDNKQKGFFSNTMQSFGFGDSNSKPKAEKQTAKESPTKTTPAPETAASGAGAEASSARPSQPATAPTGKVEEEGKEE